MDNLTHSLVGFAVGELIDRTLPSADSPEKAKLRRKLILFTSVAANNFPDLDFVLFPLLPKPLGYLLMHRGHTHTLLFVLPQAALLFLCLWLVWPKMRELLRIDFFSRVGVGLAMVLGFTLHIAFDYLNSYGVHPFHPFDSRWYYGDMVFIIEPFLWVILGCSFLAGLERKWLGYLGLVFLFGIPLYFTIEDFIPIPAYLALLGIGGSLIGFKVLSIKRNSRPYLLSLILSLLFILMQNFVSAKARKDVENRLKIRNPGSKVLDVAMSPFPSNPFCWSFHAVSLDGQQSSYSLDSGLVAPYSQAFPVGSCSKKLLGQQRLDNVEESIGWLKTNRRSISELQALVEGNCHLDAWLRFARLPLIDPDQVFDVRFSRGGVLENFSRFDYRKFSGVECPSMVPGWRHPREDILK